MTRSVLVEPVFTKVYGAQGLSTFFELRQISLNQKVWLHIDPLDGPHKLYFQTRRELELLTSAAEGLRGKKSFMRVALQVLQ